MLHSKRDIEARPVWLILAPFCFAVIIPLCTYNQLFALRRQSTGKMTFGVQWARHSPEIGWYSMSGHYLSSTAASTCPGPSPHTDHVQYYLQANIPTPTHKNMHLISYAQHWLKTVFVWCKVTTKLDRLSLHTVGGVSSLKLPLSSALHK